MRIPRWEPTPTHKVVLVLSTLLAGTATVAAAMKVWAVTVAALSASIMIFGAITMAATSLLSGRIEKNLRHVGPAERKASTIDGSPAVRVTGAMAYWTRLIDRGDIPLTWFVNHSKRTRSISARDPLTYLATRGTYNFAELTLLLETCRIQQYKEASSKTTAKSLERRYTFALAQVLFSQRNNHLDLLNALTLYDIARKSWGLGSFKNGVDRSYYADLLTESGRYDDARAVLELPEKNSARRLWHQFLRLNTHNPWISTNNSTESRWLEQLNDVYTKHGFAPISIHPGEGSPFYRLQASAPVYRGPMPLVSVLMPIYEPNAATDVAIQSVLAQSWQNLELIIVDDGSPSIDQQGKRTDYRDRLLSWEERDTRVQVIFNEENRGAYWARNTAYSRAQGKYVTVADKDDWHHPQKLEFQARELESAPEIIANLTNWVRIDENLRFLLRWGPDRLAHPSFASIMFRHAEVKEKIGFWDNVRKSADAEFKFRMQTVYGIDLQPTEPMPLAFSLIGDGNLTAGDLGLGYIHDDRRAYRWAFSAWHSKIASGSVSPYLELEPAKRPFPAPNHFLPDRPECDAFDLIYVSEFGFEAGNATVLRNEIETAVAHGLRVGIVPMQNFLVKSAAAREISNHFTDLVYSGRVVWLPLSGKAHCKLLIVRWPAVMQVTRDAPSGICADVTVVIANHMPYEAVDGRRSYDVTTVTENVKKIFGAVPLWVPESERVHSVLKDLLPRDALAVIPWKGTLSQVASQWETGRRDAKIPTIGRHARDHEGKWPGNRDDFRVIYPVDGSVRVAILGGAGVPVKKGFATAVELASWKVWKFGEIPASEYLKELDFFVYFHNDGMVEAFGMSILEAMNSGVVCILPRGFEAVFGDAAVYCEPYEVQDVIKELWQGHMLYNSQREHAYEYVRVHGSPESLLNQLARFGVVSPPASLSLLDHVRGMPKGIA